MTRPFLKYRFKQRFGEQDEPDYLYPSLSELIKLDVIAEYDIEFSGAIDGASATHKAHGDIDLSDISNYIGLDELLNLGRNSSSYAMENIGALTKEAADFGFDSARF